MVGLWSPEPPSDPSSDNLPPHNPADLFFIAAVSDDDDDNDEGYEGYEPISDGEASTSDTPDLESEEEIDNMSPAEAACPMDVDASSHIPQLNTLAARHVEALRQAYESAHPTATRNDIEMDEERQAQVVAAMANITLPPSAVPSWAESVPEEQWKQRLLERIQDLQRRGPDSK